MNRLIKILLPFLCWLQIANAENAKPIKEFALDDHSVFTIPVSSNRVTTISFPGAYSGPIRTAIPV